MRFRDSFTGYEKFEEEVWLSDEVTELDMEVAYKANRVLHYEQSPYAEISVIENKGFGRMLVFDGSPHYCTRDGFIDNEMLTHIAMTAHPAPETIALIGGGSCGQANEVLKHPGVTKLDIVELDQRVIEACRYWLPNETRSLTDSRVRLTYRDGADWLNEQTDAYDILLVDRPDPYGPALSLYRPKFYADSFRALKTDGIAVFQTGSPYYNSTLLKDTVQNLSKHFPLVRTYLASIPSVPGGIWSYTLASKGIDPLQADLKRLPSESLRYLNPELYLASFVLPGYVQQLLK